MEVGSCFRDYDDFKESFSSFKKETKCQYGLRNCVSVRNYNRKNAVNIRDAITFTHVKFECVEPVSHTKKKQKISAGCPAYLILEYSEELDRLVVKEQNSNHIHVGLRDSHIRTSTSLSVQDIERGNATSLPQKLCRKRLQKKPSMDSLEIKKRNSNHIHDDLSESHIRTNTSPLRETAPVSDTSPPQKLNRKRPKEELPGNSKECNSNHVYDSQNESQIENSTPVRETTPGPAPSPPQKLHRKSAQQELPGDGLVIEEHNSNHIHDNQRESEIGNGTPSPVQETTPVPAATLAQKSLKKRLRQKLAVEAASNGGSGSPIETNAVSLTSRENISGCALERLVEAMKDFSRVDAGAMVSISVDSTQELERLNFQTSRMRTFLTKFPESLLLHCVQSKCAYVLYAFLVESKERVGKVVHFAVLKEDTLENVSKMLSVFAEFNPECQKMKVIFTDTAFLHKLALKEIFPTAQILLSVYHTVRLIEKKAKERSALRDYLELALRDVVFSTTSENLKQLAQMLKKVLDPEFYEFLQTHWFSCEMLWYMHVKKGLHSCSTYMDSLELIIHNISSLFSKQPSLESSILYFVEYADHFNSKGLENPNQGFSYSTKVIPKKTVKKTRASTSILSSSSNLPTLPKDNVALPVNLLQTASKEALPVELPQIASKEALLVELPQNAVREETPVELPLNAVKEEPPDEPSQNAVGEESPVALSLNAVKEEPPDEQSQNAVGEEPPVALSLNAVKEEPPDEPSQNAVGEEPPVALSLNAVKEEPPDEQSQNAVGEEPPVALSLNAVKEEPPDEPPQNAVKEEFPVDLPPNTIKEELPVELSQNAVQEQLPVELSQNAVQDQLSVELPQNTVMEQLPVVLSQNAVQEQLPVVLSQNAIMEQLPVVLSQNAINEELPVKLLHKEVDDELAVELPQTTLKEVLPAKITQNVSSRVLAVLSAFKNEDHMLFTLKNLCTELAYQMCLSEWEVVKKSTQVIKVFNTSISVKLLEVTHQVNKDFQSCSCYFNSRYRLPCRHILTLLHTNKRPVEDTMVCPRWQNKYQQPSLTDKDLRDRVRYSALSDEAGDERFAKMKSLSKELSNLLLQCEGAELKERCSTLQMIVDIWKKPHKRAEDVNVGTVENLGELPPLWVKQEDSEMEHFSAS